MILYPDIVRWKCLINGVSCLRKTCSSIDDLASWKAKLTPSMKFRQLVYSPKPNRTRWNLQILPPLQFQIGHGCKASENQMAKTVFMIKIKIVSEFVSVDSLRFKLYIKQVHRQCRRKDICQKRLCFSKVNMTKPFSIDVFSTLAISKQNARLEDY